MAFSSPWSPLLRGTIEGDISVTKRRNRSHGNLRLAAGHPEKTNSD